MTRALDRADIALRAWAALAVAIVTANVAVWLAHIPPAPFADMIDVEWFLSRWSLAHDGLGPILTYPDNEHRAFLPLLLQALDRGAFGSTGVFLVVIHILCFALAAALFARHAALGHDGRPRLAAAAAISMALAFLWSAHWNNIVWSKQTHVALALVSVAGAFWLMARIDRRRVAGEASEPWTEPWAELAGAAALLLNAAWSFAAGLAALPVAVAFVALRPWSWRARAAIVAAAIVAAGTRAWAGLAAGGGGVGDASAGLVDQALYTLNFLGGLSRAALGGDEILAPILAALALVLAAPLLRLALWRPARRRLGLDPAREQAASFLALSLLWALACAAGITLLRAHFGPDQAFAVRYVIFSVVFLASTAMLAATLAPALPRWTRRATLWVSVVYLAAMTLTTPRGWLLTAEHDRQVALGAVAAALGVDEPEHALYPALPDGRLTALVEDYRARDAAFFARDWARWLGAPAAEALPPADAVTCANLSADWTVAPLADAGAHRISARLTGGAPRWLAVVDADGQVAGLLRRGERFRQPTLPQVEGPTHVGIARLDDPGAARLLAVVRGGRSCDLGVPVSSAPSTTSDRR
jgi:hypothetical protein